MARKQVVPVYEDFVLTSDDLDSLEEGTEVAMTIRTNLPLKHIRAVEEAKTSGPIIDMVLMMIHKWDEEAMGLPLSAEGLMEMDMVELRDLLTAVYRMITNPQKPTSVATR